MQKKKKIRHGINKSEWKRQEEKSANEFFFLIRHVSLTQAGPIGTSPNKPMPSTWLSAGCFSYISRLKSCLPESPPINQCPVHSLRDVSLPCPSWNGAYAKLPQTHAHSTLSLFLLHIQAEIVPTGNNSHKPMLSMLYRMFLLHIQAEIVPTRISPHKPVSNTFSKACFSSMSRLKGCRRKTPTNSCPLHSLCFSYTSKLKSCRQGTTPTNPCSVRSTGCSSYRLKHFLGDVSLVIQAEMVPVGNYSN